ncbi:MAG: alpha/beta hydrolase [Chitinophagaceae bacterium]
MVNNRREFIKNSSLLIGAISGGGVTTLANAAPGPVSTFQNKQKTVYLWSDTSVNNGKDPVKRPRLDFFIPETKTDKKRAAIIVCPGGGYGGLAPHEGVPFAELFAAKGIVSAVLYYRVSPNRYPAPFADAVRAMRLVRSQAESLNIDPNKIGIIGFSAGGHLSATVATQPDLYKDPEDTLASAVSARPNRVMLGYPVISFEEYGHMGSAKNLLGDNPPPDMLRQLSNQKQVTTENPPAFIFHTADDEVVPVQNSFFFAEACVRNKVSTSLHVYPNGKHGVGMALTIPALSSWTEILLKWLEDWHGNV